MDAVGRCGDICIVPHLEGVVLKIFMYVVCIYMLLLITVCFLCSFVVIEVEKLQ